MSLSHAFPPILPREDLPRRVLVVVAHPDDEIIGIGGLLAFHGRRGDQVRVVHATPGAQGDPEGRFEDLPKLRWAEVTRALAGLGIDAPECLGFDDGGLEASLPALIDSMRGLFTEYGPELLYTFQPGEFHTDHRSLAVATCEARDALPASCLVHLFGVNQVPPFASLYDYTDLLEAKQQALACFETQLAYLDFAAKVMHRDQAATVNVELQEITHCEQILACSPRSWPAIVDDHESSRKLAMEDQS